MELGVDSGAMSLYRLVRAVVNVNVKRLALGISSVSWAETHAGYTGQRTDLKAGGNPDRFVGVLKDIRLTSFPRTAKTDTPSTSSPRHRFTTHPATGIKDVNPQRAKDTRHDKTSKLFVNHVVGR